MSDRLEKLGASLEKYRRTSGVVSKGDICVALFISNAIIPMAAPYDAENFLAPNKTQVSRINGMIIAKILREHGITQRYTSEGGRTNRGAVEGMRRYLDFLNSLGPLSRPELDFIVKYWAEVIRAQLSEQPFRLSGDPGLSIRAIFKDIFRQAVERQRARPGAMLVGTIMQHLVGAKLQVLLGTVNVRHHHANNSDLQTAREADFEVGDTAIHVTVSPSQALVLKCQENIKNGKKPLVLTSEEGLIMGQRLAEDSGLDVRIDFLSAEQFLAGNLHEWSGFNTRNRSAELKKLVDAYNLIVDNYENNPSLKIKSSGGRD